jgi:CRP-like cAMP-binding protein
MPDFNPSLLRRMLFLRQYPLFAGAELEELASVGENVVAKRFAAGSVVAPVGSRLSSLQLVVSGSITTSTERWEARQVFGALEIAAARTVSEAAIAAVDTETLELSAADFEEVLEDNFGVMLSTIRTLSARMLAMPRPQRAASVKLELAGSLGLVERLIVLRGLVPFACARVQALAALAHDSNEVRFPAGTLLMRSGEMAPGGLVILEGRARCVRDTLCREATPGAAFGYLEALAGQPLFETVEAITEVRALRSPIPTILDVLEDHPDVGLAMIAAFAGALLDTADTAN